MLCISAHSFDQLLALGPHMARTAWPCRREAITSAEQYGFGSDGASDETKKAARHALAAAGGTLEFYARGGPLSVRIYCRLRHTPFRVSFIYSFLQLIGSMLICGSLFEQCARLVREHAAVA